MVLSLADAWIAEMSRSGVKPIYLVSFELGPAAYLTVLDYTAGAGDTFGVRITEGGGPSTFTEGTHFDAEISASQTATNIAETINANGALALVMYAAARGPLVSLIPISTSLPWLEFTTSDATAWTTSPRRLPKTIKCVSGSVAYEGYPNCVSRISPVANSIDVVSRAGSIGDVEITVADDGFLREFLLRARPKGRKVTVTIGCEALDEADFAPVGVYVIDEMRPEPGAITLTCVEPISYVWDNKITGTFIQMHPLALIREALQQAGFATTLYDDDTLDSTDAAYDTISHWSTRRHSYLASTVYGAAGGPSNAISEPIPAKEVIDQCSQMLNGSLLYGETGEYGFRIYDSTDTEVRALDESVISDFEQVSTFEHYYNSVAALGIVDPRADDGSRTALYTNTDTLSRSLSGISGENQNYSLSLESDWIGAWGHLYHDLPDASGTTLHVVGVAAGGMSGTRPETVYTDVYQQATQRSEDEPSASRLVTLLIIDSVKYEFLECDAFTYVATDASDLPAYHANTQYYGYTEPDISGGAVNSVTGVPYAQCHEYGIFTVSTRGVLGSTAQDWTAAPGTLSDISDFPRVYDITIARAMADARIARFSNGCPIIRFRTSLAHYDLQLGDLITVSHRVYLNFDKDGSDTDVVWEIISKELVPLDDSPGVVFTCAWVRDDVALVAIGGYSPPPVEAFPLVDLEVVTDNAGATVTISTLETVYRG